MRIVVCTARQVRITRAMSRTLFQEKDEEEQVEDQAALPLSAENWDGAAVAAQSKATWPCQPCRTCRNATASLHVCQCSNTTHRHNTQGLL